MRVSKNEDGDSSLCLKASASRFVAGHCMSPAPTAVDFI